MPPDEQNTEPPRSPENRLGLDYRDVPPPRVAGPIIDVHTHVHAGAQADLFFEAARLYGVSRVLSMSPIGDCRVLHERFGERIGFIAIPNWKQMSDNDEFRRGWIADLRTFRDEHGARICKFWMAPPMRERHGWTMPHEFLRPVVDAALELGYHFMIHCGDPSVWFAAGQRYADAAKFGTKRDQYPQLEWLCEYVAPRFVISAHMGGTVEDPSLLQELFDRHANLRLDCSATKWIVREVARRPAEVKRLIERNPTRILFGSDIVASEKFTTFDHFASRYWAQRMMWESGYRGESPIDDPDAENPPRLAGLELPTDVLSRLYRENIEELGLAGRRSS